MMGYEYLWINVRVKGGAYGCMCKFSRGGDSYFVSYRDPNLSKTVDIFENAAKAVSDFEADERTMTQYIIGAVSELDMPKNPAAKGLYALSAYMTGVTEDMIQKERDEILSAEPEDIKKLSEYIKAFMSDDLFCVVGNAGKIKEEEKRFMKIENLF
jgi:Zn-dependent M16 (insulinase) family peptidase